MARSGPRRRFDHEEIAALAARGLTTSQIAEQLGCSRATVAAARSLARTRADREVREAVRGVPQQPPPQQPAAPPTLRTIHAEWLTLAAEAQVAMRASLTAAGDPRAYAIAAGIASQHALALERHLARVGDLPAAQPVDEAARQAVADDMTYRAARDGSARALERLLQAATPRSFEIVFTGDEAATDAADREGLTGAPPQEPALARRDT